NNLTCIISANGAGTATHDPGAGWRLREGIFATINDALVISSFVENDQGSANDNYCLRIDNRSQTAAIDGDLTLNAVIFACQENSRGQPFGAFASEQDFAESLGNIFSVVPDGTVMSATAVSNPELQLLEGTVPVYSIDYATMQVDTDGDNVGEVPAGAPTAGTFVGGLSLGATDWTAGWTYGIHSANRGQALWFEGL
ncbi:MAG: serine/threonine protein kinase, partial [Gammaproteobacteria bacterium]|nr:serine/threonine protein kinase [Gammaproteobacteria bacterium]